MLVEPSIIPLGREVHISDEEGRHAGAGDDRAGA